MQQRASTGTLHVLYNLCCDGLVPCAPPSASADLVGAQTHLHFLYAVFWCLACARWEKVIGAPEDQLKTFT